MSTQEPPKPRRAVEMRISIGGNTWKDVQQALREICMDADERAAEGMRNIVSGSPSCGYSVTTTVIEKTHDEYFAEVEAYLEATRPARKTVADPAPAQRPEPETQDPQ